MPTSAPSSASTFTSPTTPCFARDVARLERRRDEPVDGCDDEKASVSGSGERIPRVFRQEERAGEQERDERVPPFLGELSDRRDVLVVRSPSSTSTACTFHRSASSRSAIAAPMPRAAPVTSTFIG